VDDLSLCQTFLEVKREGEANLDFETRILKRFFGCREITSILSEMGAQSSMESVEPQKSNREGRTRKTRTPLRCLRTLARPKQKQETSKASEYIAQKLDGRLISMIGITLRQSEARSYAERNFAYLERTDEGELHHAGW